MPIFGDRAPPDTSLSPHPRLYRGKPLIPQRNQKGKCPTSITSNT